MELHFLSDTKERKQYFTKESFAHPAKMMLPLQRWIIERYTKPGDVVLDPMAGSGTILVACTMGRNVIAVELEQPFVDMMKDNWEKVKTKGPQLGCQMGEAVIVQGDSRNLEGVLADTIITSPPYAKAQSGGGIAKRGYQGSKHSPTDLVGKRSYMPEQAGQSEGQISNLPYGKIEVVVSSPPYVTGARGASRNPFWQKLSQDPTSARAGREQHPSLGEEYSHNKENIGNLPYGKVDSVITSPPYEGTLSEPEDRKHSIDQSKWGDGRKVAPPHSQVHLTYPSSLENIGNLKNQSYLDAMLQCYKSCHAVLRPQGLLILVLKNFIRNREIVRLDSDSIRLCEEAGFKFIERHSRKITSQSFWRTLYQQRFPDAPVINHEDILAFSKEG